ncbi:MAG: glycosyltransferase family 9 protein [Candidatus Zixiibacteriota bacterium]
MKRDKGKKDELDLSNVKKILVVRQDDRIGNLILTTPFLSALRQLCPRARVSYLVSRKFQALLSGSKLVDEVLVAEKRRFIRNPFRFLSFVLKLRKERFDLAFDLSDENEFSLSNSFITYLSQARHRVGHKKENSDLFLNIQIPRPEKPRHAIDMHLDLLRFLTGDFKLVDLNLGVSPKNKRIIKEYLESKDVSENDFLAGINLGAREKKRWKLSHFESVAHWITRELNLKVIFIHGPEEKNLIEKLGKSANDRFLFADIFPLNLLSALIERCDLMISGDSGIMHLSVSVGTPTLAIFLDSDPVKYGPRGEKHQTILPENGEVSIKSVKGKILYMLKNSGEKKFSQLELDLVKEKYK